MGRYQPVVTYMTSAEFEALGRNVRSIGRGR